MPFPFENSVNKVKLIVLLPSALFILSKLGKNSRRKQSKKMKQKEINETKEYNVTVPIA